MADISDGFMELRFSAVPERQKAFCEKKKYIRPLYSTNELQRKSYNGD